MSSSIEMVKGMRVPYQRLGQEGFLDGSESEEQRERFVQRPRSWFKYRRVHIRRRFRVKVPSLRRFLRRRFKLVSRVRVSCAMVLKRLKEGQGYLGDLFAGNYMFMQVNPTSLKTLEKSYYGNGLKASSGLPPKLLNFKSGLKA